MAAGTWLRTLGIGLKWLFILLAGLFALLALAWTLSRLAPIPAQRSQALQTLAMPPLPAGRNAYAALVTLGREVPPEHMETVAREAFAQFAAQDQRLLAGDAPPQPQPQPETALDRFARLPDHALPGNRRCTGTALDCLARIRADLPAYAAWLKRFQPQRTQIERLAEYDFLRQPDATLTDPALNRMSLLRLMTQAHLTQFANGDTDAALNGVCQTMQRDFKLFLNSPDGLLPNMAGVDRLSFDGQALALMLAERPAGQPLPPPCADLLTLSARQDYSLCNTLKGERRMLAYLLDSGMSPGGRNLLERVAIPLVYDADKTLALQAETLARYCEPGFKQQIEADRKAAMPLEDRSRVQLLRFECWANFAGCLLTEITLSNYDSYQHRLQDLLLRMQALRSIAWLRQQPEAAALLQARGVAPLQDLQALLDRRPDALRSTQRPLTVVEDAGRLQVQGDSYGSAPGNRDGKIAPWRLALTAGGQ